MIQRCKRGQAVALALLLLGCAGQEAAEAPEGARPNVVLILADDLGYGDVHALNPGSTLPTPYLDALADEGLLFTDAHSPSAVCTPTRYGLLTGRYAWRTRLERGVLGGYSAPLLEPERPTLATRLDALGYRTAAIGKWHLGMQLPFLDESTADRTPWNGDPGVDYEGTITDGPLQHGFDECFGVTGSLDMPPYVFVRDDHFEGQPTDEQPAQPFPHFVRRGPRTEDFSTEDALDRVITEARAFLTRAAEEDAPFFLYLPLTAPHKPTQPHPRFRGSTALGEYGDFVRQVDWSIGQVLSALETNGQSQDTLVIVTSDNGSYMRRLSDVEAPDHVERSSVQAYHPTRHRSNGPLRGTKADIWEAGHRVPLLVRWPGHVAAGGTSSEAVCLTDVYATVADAFALTLTDAEAEDSLSFLGVLQGEGAPRGAPIVHHSVAGMFAIREGRWKLVCGNGSGGREAPKGAPFAEPFQLYDLDADLGETTDLAAEHPEVVRRLYAKLEELRSEGRSAPARSPSGS